MTHGGQEPAEPAPQNPEQHRSPSGTVYSGPPMPPRLAADPQQSGRKLALIMGAMTVFFIVLVVLATWAAERG